LNGTGRSRPLGETSACRIGKIFVRPIVIASAGGAHGGGAQLTDLGRALIAAYRRIEERTRLAIREELAPFETDLVVKRLGANQTWTTSFGCQADLASIRGKKRL